jgi:hypothetical protein
MKRITSIAAAICLMASASAAQATTSIDFDTGTDNVAVGSFYAGQGITFSNATFYDNFGLVGSSGTLAIGSTTSDPYHFGIANAISAAFSGVASSITIRGIDVGNAGIQIDAFDASNVLLGSSSFFGPGVGVGTFQDITVSFAGIKSFKLYQPSFNEVDGVLFDNLSFESTSGVPETATWAMMILGMGMIGGAMRRRNVKTSVRFA